MIVSLITTVLNEKDSIDALLAAIDRQTWSPDEVIVVDGGSTDGTLDAVESWARDRVDRKVISAPNSNISRGRNIGIKAAASKIVAITDAGAYPEQNWLSELMVAMQDGPFDVAMGFYEPDPRNLFEAIQGCLNLPDAAEIDPKRFMPSSRSIAFTKTVWEQAGGYPEWLDIGEDMYFNFQVLENEGSRVFVPHAIVKWRLRPTLTGFLVQYYKYARGDAIARMHRKRHLIRFGAYLGGSVIALSATMWPLLLLIPVAAGAYWLRHAYKRANKRIQRGKAIAFITLPFLNAMMDLAKMLGYLVGTAQRDQILRRNT